MNISERHMKKCHWVCKKASLLVYFWKYILTAHSVCCSQISNAAHFWTFLGKSFMQCILMWYYTVLTISLPLFDSIKNFGNSKCKMQCKSLGWDDSCQAHGNVVFCLSRRLGVVGSACLLHSCCSCVVRWCWIISCTIANMFGTATGLSCESQLAIRWDHKGPTIIAKYRKQNKLNIINSKIYFVLKPNKPKWFIIHDHLDCSFFTFCEVAWWRVVNASHTRLLAPMHRYSRIDHELFAACVLVGPHQNWSAKMDVAHIGFPMMTKEAWYDPDMEDILEIP